MNSSTFTLCERSLTYRYNDEVSSTCKYWTIFVPLAFITPFTIIQLFLCTVYISGFRLCRFYLLAHAKLYYTGFGDVDQIIPVNKCVLNISTFVVVQLREDPGETLINKLTQSGIESELLDEMQWYERLRHLDLSQSHHWQFE